jgi:S1-C subfamily serine protease
MKLIILFFTVLISQISLSQTIRSIEIDTYKYLVIDEIAGKHSGEMRRFLVKNLKEAGYNIVNLKEPLKTHNAIPEDLKKDPDLALYVVATENNSFCVTVETKLMDAANKIKLSRFGESCSLLSTAIKKSISSLTSYNYKYQPDQKRIEPKINPNQNRDWLGNGSGILFSKSGHIITNYHVINNATQIGIEFLYEGTIKNYNAEIVIVDKINDLAIIKIINNELNGFENIPYNFKTKSSDVGTKVYAYGYPMALSVMGKEIKVTDGIISSKSGYNGNITTYQITAPIQPGNSGGPLFDDEGNLIGITSSGINKAMTDNVGYAIKTSYLNNLIDALQDKIDMPSSEKLKSLSLVEQIKAISKYVVLIKIK